MGYKLYLGCIKHLKTYKEKDYKYMCHVLMMTISYDGFTGDFHFILYSVCIVCIFYIACFTFTIDNYF